MYRGSFFYIVVAVIFLVYQFFGVNHALLLFFVYCKLDLFRELFRELKIVKLIREKKIIEGEIISSVIQESKDDSNVFFILTIEFYIPGNSEKQIINKFVSNYTGTRKCKIVLNANDITESTVLLEQQTSRSFKLGGIFIAILILLIIDILLLIKII